jgi:hypothetical protein
MTGNNFHPEIVEHVIELIKTGETDLRGAIHRDYPVLTALGIERVLGIASEKIVERFTLTADGEFEPLVEGSTMPISLTQTHAGICKVKRYGFSMA